jgi:hypothetical protein
MLVRPIAHPTVSLLHLFHGLGGSLVRPRSCGNYEGMNTNDPQAGNTQSTKGASILARVAGVWRPKVEGLVVFVVYRVGVPSNNLVAIPHVIAVAVWAYWAYHVVPTFIAMARGKQGL